MNCTLNLIGLVLAAGAAPGCMFSPPLPVTRSDLASAYLDFEQAAQANPPTGDKVARTNRRFDEATVAFFTGANVQAIKAIDELTDALRFAESPPLDQRVAGSLKIRIDPPVLTPQATARAKLAAIYRAEVDGMHELDFTLRVRAADGRTLLEKPFCVQVDPFQFAEADVPLLAGNETIEQGWHVVEIVTRSGAAVRVVRWAVVSRSPDETRSANETRLSGVKAESPELQQALATCRARNALLVNRPSETVSAQFLADPLSLATELEQEIAALTEGRNPYRRRVGDYWRVIRVETTDIPCRVYAPAAAGNEPALPLIVALHGAGGDENMFMDAYGAGLIKKLADEKGFVVASPQVGPFTARTAAFDTLVDTLAREYTIDPQRVYVIGHSLGGGVAAGLARGRADRIAAVATFSSFLTYGGAEKVAPTLAISGELDLVAQPLIVKRSIEQAQKAGLPVEYQLIKNYGHTLIVDAQLRSAIDWLLQRRLAN